MNEFTGRRPSDRARRIGKGILEGLSAIGTAMADEPKRARIEEIDEEIKNLKQERDHLIKTLIEPGDLKVSKNFDPYWRKPEERTRVRVMPVGEGRLTKCKGRSYMGKFHDAHPGCPYIDTIHGPHEFTLRD